MDLFVNQILKEGINKDIYFHGSNQEFNEFELNNNKTYKEFDISVWFFTKDLNYAQSYGQYIYTVKLNIHKTLDLSNPNHYKLFEETVEEYHDDLETILDEQFFNGLPYWTCENAYYCAMNNGFDSILLQEELEKEVISIGVFNKNNIKIISKEKWK